MIQFYWSKFVINVMSHAKQLKIEHYVFFLMRSYFRNVVEENRYKGQYSRYREKLRKLENEAACLKEQADTISTSSVKPVDLTNPVVPGKYTTEELKDNKNCQCLNAQGVFLFFACFAIVLNQIIQSVYKMSPAF